MQAKATRASLVAVLTALAAATTPSPAPADDTPTCPSSTEDAYSMTADALTGPKTTDLTLTVKAAPGCEAATSVKHIQIKTFTTTGGVDIVRNLREREADDGIVQIVLPRVHRGARIEADAEVQTGAPVRTYVVRDATTSLLRPDLVVREVRAPKSTLTTNPFVVTAVIDEVNGDVGATAHATLAGDLGYLGDPVDVTVAPGQSAVVTFAALSLPEAVPTKLKVDVNDATPAEYDAVNGARTVTVDVTKNELPASTRVLFPSLRGYGAQFGMHLYAPVTPWPPGLGYADVEDKVKTLAPQLVRIFYNDNWDANANGKFPGWQTNYDSFVKVVQLAQEAGATIDVSFQNLGNLPTIPIPTMMSRFADVLQDLVVNHGLTNVRWAETGNEPNLGGGVSLDQYTALFRSLNDALVARGLRDQIQLMAGGLVENTTTILPNRTHYDWMPVIAATVGDIADGYAEHVYWKYFDTGRFEYRLRDTWHLLNEVIPPDQRKPTYLMEFGIRGDKNCGTKPAFDNLYYGADPTCPEIWRTNIAGFQQLWFNIDSAQLGVAGTSKWDAYWSRYDNSSAGNQLYWMIGPPTEGSPLTPTYYAMSLLFHTTAPGWQVIGVDPWNKSDWGVPNDGYDVVGGHASSDQPEQELIAYAGPNGELTVMGLDSNGKDLNTASSDPPSSYSIGGLPADTVFNLALWNATGDGRDTIGGTVTTNSVGVARFEVPLQAAFALTTVPVA
jgi:hypothetical protein